MTASDVVLLLFTLLLCGGGFGFAKTAPGEPPEKQL